ncbi:single-stranded DNA-binding protein [Nesterenkonia sp. LB17]|uniref:single-stranded DNA-binding protein n=1 Tax=unclassified Nesterenkonia TaxID=2629769 RepID=UPI001F4CD8AE|nr:MULTISPECIES: single-stranded DNA-binding protein [unclassified Nesterenkonia]MCH8560879.1 single-stranded DNA-binding protein [Nesterenkonia sp. DZ6]MCH8563511.1 single-stranded DNA-binding protein [Nesterenkonia sp. YGD6]MCH8566161.1 single-stranded DNA-binding protein [Nesterenkonia sp. LB17]MCH8570959.1 single-stranded DNA-binding protein [Nesterenkonia sp. AY15]
MAGETIITVVGNLTADPELRFTPSGAAVSNFAIASTPRFFDRQANEWKDGETLFVRCSLWREAAENAAESLTKGTRVIAQGRLKARSFQTKEGENRTSWELDVDEIGPSLRFATASVQRSSGGQGGRPSGGGGFGGGNTGGNAGAASGGGFGGGGSGGGASSGGSGGWSNDSAPQDPWGGQPSGGGSWGTPDNNEPPF